MSFILILKLKYGLWMSFLSSAETAENSENFRHFFRHLKDEYLLTTFY
mgnify:CR=1 FL=1